MPGICFKLLRSLYYSSYLKLLRPIPRAYAAHRGRQRIVVLVYHHVNDQNQDLVTLSTNCFEQQMAYLKTHHPLVDVGALVHGRYPNNSRRTVVAVTFDDGYLDAYQNAVPVLVRHGIPAAFFVSTALIGTDGSFRHDLRRYAKPFPVMNWEQLRELSRLGFTVGSHTATHINCSKLNLAQVVAELTQSKTALERELGLKEVFFAYPFGGSNDITPAVHQAVQECGYAACLSAHGGFNRPPIDPFRIKRVGINHRFDSLAFRARLDGYRFRGEAF